MRKIDEQSSHTLAFLNLRKHVGIVMKNGNSAAVISDLTDTDRNYKYSVQPYLDSCGVKDVKVYNLKQDLRLAFAAKKYNLVQFRGLKILICNGQAELGLINNLFKPDYIYLTGNPHASINSMDKNHVPQTLVVDGNNSDHFISTIQKRVVASGIKLNVLKRNKSLLLVSN